MKTLSTEEVAHIAKLCRLALSDSETETFRTQLSGILSYVDKLQSIDTANVEGTNQVTEQTNVYRPDVVVPQSSETIETILGNVPERDGDGVQVPPVL